MATIDDDLIDNLREGLAQHVRHGETAPLLSAAQKIVELGPPGLPFDQARTAGRVQDRDGDVWLRGGDGRWRLTGTEEYGFSLGREELIELYGPLREVRDE